MSHVATVDVEVKDLDSLAQACSAIGCTLVRDQKTYRWFGQHVGDYPLPTGFTEEELGKCDHAIRVAQDFPDLDDDSKPYEIGVIRRRDGRPGYTLLWDFFAGGMGLEERVGADCSKLRQQYALAVTRKQAAAQGFTAHAQQQADGSIRVMLRK